VEREDAFRTLGFTGSGTATSRLPSKLSPSIAWRKTTKSALRAILSSHTKGPNQEIQVAYRSSEIRLTCIPAALPHFAWLSLASMKSRRQGKSGTLYPFTTQSFTRCNRYAVAALGLSPH